MNCILYTESIRTNNVMLDIVTYVKHESSHPVVLVVKISQSYRRNPNLPEITDKRYHTSCMTSMRIECSTLVVIALITTNFTIIPTQST
jgi:hypothetical protein